MFVNFSSLPETARVWIYQSNRRFSDFEVKEISKELEAFINAWKRHGDDLKASFKIIYNQFVVISVDENYNNVSGCSIDASVNFIKNLERKYTIDLTDKMNISFKDGENVNIVKMSDFQKYASQNKITSNTFVFNNLVNTVKEFNENWEIPAEKSWHKRFLKV